MKQNVFFNKDYNMTKSEWDLLAASQQVMGSACQGAEPNQRPVVTRHTPEQIHHQFTLGVSPSWFSNFSSTLKPLATFSPPILT